MYSKTFKSYKITYLTDFLVIPRIHTQIRIYVFSHEKTFLIWLFDEVYVKNVVRSICYAIYLSLAYVFCNASSYLFFTPNNL